MEIYDNEPLKHCVEKLEKIFGLSFIEGESRGKREYIGTDGIVKAIVKPSIERGRINVDVNDNRLCEINTYEKDYRIATHSFPSFVENYDSHKNHFSTRMSREEFFPFIVKWVNTVLRKEKYFI